VHAGEEFLAIGAVGFDVDFFPGFQLGYVAASPIVEGGTRVARRYGYRRHCECREELGLARVTAQARGLSGHRRDIPRILRIQDDIVFLFRAAPHEDHHEKRHCND